MTVPAGARLRIKLLLAQEERLLFGLTDIVSYDESLHAELLTGGCPAGALSTTSDDRTML